MISTDIAQSVTTCDDLVTTYLKGVVTAESRIPPGLGGGCDDRDDLSLYIHTRAPAYTHIFNLGRHSRHKVTLPVKNQQLNPSRPTRFRSSQVVTGRHT